ncbi:hypothetical protein DB30_07331 [Enhygromyxa salina]|uniref:Uncharacterized protein n=1 Tax=Enhygromyxa salina TaxID=215803 RepID=A0A0C1Z8P1_9BACT|nr:hypothetical protein DB30_07331 [Enhygromyxa salina]
MDQLDTAAALARVEQHCETSKDPQLCARRDTLRSLPRSPP